MTLQYLSQSASKLASVATNRRTVSSSSENLASNDRMRSTTSLVSHLQGMSRMTDCSPVFRTTLFSRQDLTTSD